MELIEFSYATLALLFIAAVCAGFVDTLAGGGGLITLPALILAGINPLAALGTNKLQASAGTATASAMMLRHRRVKFSAVKGLFVLALAGSALGAVLVQFIDISVLRWVIPSVLVVIAGYFIALPYLPVAKHKYPRVFRYGAVPGVGMYDGMFGPATGSFFALSGVALNGQSVIDSTAQAKLLNFATNLASLMIFVVAGKVVWLAGAVMIAGQAVGAWAGSHCLIRIAPGVLRVIIVLVCLLMLARYFVG